MFRTYDAFDVTEPTPSRVLCLQQREETELSLLSSISATAAKFGVDFGPFSQLHGATHTDKYSAIL